MTHLFKFAVPSLLLLTLPVLAVAYYRWRYYRPITYHYPLGQLLATQVGLSRSWAKFSLYSIRLLSLLLLALLMARPQLVDYYSRINVDGIDICLALDVSGSMQLYDGPQETQMRFEIAKAEALKFIAKRENDAIGLVLFGKYAISRCPLTLDKKILTQILTELPLGFIDPNGTVLARALVTAANRLKNSPAKSKVIILLTDGAPTPDDLEITPVLKLLQELKIKVYTIGIGNPNGAYVDSWLGRVPVQVELDQQLLKQIAWATGGQSFTVQNTRDLAKIYQQIDQLERVEHQAEIFTNRYELAGFWLLAILLFLLLELLLKATIWRGINL